MCRMTDSDTPIPSFELNAKLVGKRDCFDAWREAVREIYDVEPLFEGVSDRERAQGWLLGNLFFTEVAFSPALFGHEPRHAQGISYLSIQIYKEGRMRGIADGNYFDVSPGAVHIFDFSRVFRSTTENSVVSGLFIPHEAVGYDPAYHPAHIMFAGHTPAGRYLLRSFFAMQDLLPNLRSDEANLLADGFCGLLRGYIDQRDTEDPAIRALRMERSAEIRSYLDRHLTDPGLSVDRVCGVFNVSRSSLYRDFASVGGVGQYIAKRRMERTLHLLLSTPSSHDRIRRIAAESGYKDPDQFSRIFRQRFGVSPSRIFGGKRAGEIPYRGQWQGPFDVQTGAVVGDWLRSM